MSYETMKNHETIKNAEERALKLCQIIGATTMFKEWNDGMSLPLQVSKDIAIVCINELCGVTEYWEMVKVEIDNLK